MVPGKFFRVVGRKRVRSLTTSHKPVTARSSNATAASSSLRRTMSDCPKNAFCLLIFFLGFIDVQHATPQGVMAASASMLCRLNVPYAIAIIADRAIGRKFPHARGIED